MTLLTFLLSCVGSVPYHSLHFFLSTLCCDASLRCGAVLSSAGTVRSLKPDVQRIFMERMEEVCRGAGVSFGCQVDLEYRRGYPATVNRSKAAYALVQAAAADTGTHPGLAIATVLTCHSACSPSLSCDSKKECVKTVCQGIISCRCPYAPLFPLALSVGAERVEIAENPTMGAEDFSYFLNERDGAFWFVGACPRHDALADFPHHKSTFDFNEQALLIGASVFYRIVEKLIF